MPGPFGAIATGLGLAQSGVGSLTGFLQQGILNDLASGQRRGATGTSMDLIRALLGAPGEHALNVFPGLRDFLVQPGDPEAQFLSVGTLRPDTPESFFGPGRVAGIDPFVANTRRDLFHLLASQAITDAEADTLAQNATLAASQQAPQAAPTSNPAQLAQGLGAGFGGVGLAGAQSRIQAGLANQQRQREAQALATQFVTGLHQLASSTF